MNAQGSTVSSTAHPAHEPDRKRVISGLVMYVVLVLIVFASAVVLSILADGGALIWALTLFGALVISAIIAAAIPAILKGE